MRHRLNCCSDTHGAMPPLLDETGVLGWLHAGDVCNGALLRGLTSQHCGTQEQTSVARWFADRGERVHIVPGNHDVIDVYHAFRNCSDVSGRIVQIAEHLFVAGIGWHGERYFELPLERDLNDVCQSVVRQGMRMLFGKDRLILLTHYPPRYVGTHHVENDKDGGGVWYDSVKGVVELLEPILIVQGHNHGWFGAHHEFALATRETLIVNPGPIGCAVEVDVDLGIAHLSEK